MKPREFARLFLDALAATAAELLGLIAWALAAAVLLGPPVLVYLLALAYFARCRD